MGAQRDGEEGCECGEEGEGAPGVRVFIYTTRSPGCPYRPIANANANTNTKPGRACKDGGIWARAGTPGALPLSYGHVKPLFVTNPTVQLALSFSKHGILPSFSCKHAFAYSLVGCGPPKCLSKRGDTNGTCVHSSHRLHVPSLAPSVPPVCSARRSHANNTSRRWLGQTEFPLGSALARLGSL